ncbi:MAG: cytochrome C oxidase subunit III [Bdellovibrionaceae bacterium]|nr:cytochrome C oxidase subunit III [Pseudobdellovibrionaceae bacterium]
MAIVASERKHSEHFNSAEHEFVSSKQGMWLFLLQEVLFFAGLFVAYGIFRALNPEMFHAASQMLDVKMGALNTVVLICSSLTMAFAVRSAQTNQTKKTTMYLIVTFLLASVFLVVKYFEYSHKFHVGLLPGQYFTNTELTDPKSGLFFSLYFMMTGVHGLHIILGMLVILWLVRRSSRNEFGSNYYTPVELFGLYWHFVDLIWIYLFPLLYLID